MRYVYLAVSILINYVIGHYLLTGAAAVYTSVLVSYHLYLVILIMISEREKGLALPIGHAIVTHAAFLAIVIGLPAIREHVPLFGVLRLFIPALAPFEVNWIFSKDKKIGAPEEAEKSQEKVKVKKGEPISIDDLITQATADDHEIFLAYLRQPNRTFSRPGRSVREEYGYWLADRAKKKAAYAVAIASAAEATVPAGASREPGSPDA